MPPPPPLSSVPDYSSQPARRRRPLGKTLLLLTRTLHIYLTMCGLILLLFFSFTGFLLNNGQLRSNSGKLFDLNVDRPNSLGSTTQRLATIPVALLTGKEHLFAIEQYLRKQLGARGELAGDPDDSDGSTIRYQFTGPGRKADFVIITKIDDAPKTADPVAAAPLGATPPPASDKIGDVKITESRNLLATLTDLHTGEHSGRVWVWFIDATAIFLFCAALSGLILWLSLPKRRTLGLIALIISIALCLSAFLWLVP